MTHDHLMSPGRILIVDDEVELMSALRDVVTAQGYDAVGVTSGNDALATLREREFDLLLTDLMMPDMDGIAVLREGLQIDPDLVGIIMTGQATVQTAVDAMKVGAFDYLMKPFKANLLLPLLSRAMGVRRLRNEKADLEQRVRERTAQLEAANKELEAFSYSVSHDLRTPLRTLDGFAELLERRAAQLPEEERFCLQNLRETARQMGRLIDDLLELARMSREPLKTQLVETGELVRNVLDELRKQEGERRIEIIIGELPRCQADPLLLKQVFVNLLSNALKYTRKREVARIEIGSLPIADFQLPIGGAGTIGNRQSAIGNANEVVFFVRDNGAGFDMQQADRLFSAFRRLHSSEEFEGTGVGLAIVQRIIHRHGGRVWAEAEVEKGATFYFRLSG